MSDQHRELVIEGDQVAGVKDAPKRWVAKVEARPRYNRDTGEREPDLIMGHVRDGADRDVAMVYGPDEEIAPWTHLLAAAPDLLAALRRVLAHYRFIENGSDFADAWAAIRKAEGRE